MAKILLTYCVPTEPILRQIPRKNASWCGHEFSLMHSGEAVDAWVVYDNLLRPETIAIDRRRTMLVTGEPPCLRRYRSGFTSQFGGVRTSHEAILHPNVVLGHEAQPWHFGMHPCQTHSQVLDYDTLASFAPPIKTKLLSVIASNKVITDDHRQRLRFVEQLKSAFGDQIDVFGRGIRDIPDKADAIWNYKYHIAMENDHSDLYMSEKLPDCFLGWSFPFYSGGTFADGVLPKKSFARIDMYNPTRSIETIRFHMQSSSYETNLEWIGKARSLVLEELNLFAVLCKAYDSMNSRVLELPQRKNTLTTLLPKKKSVRLSLRRLMRAIALVG